MLPVEGGRWLVTLLGGGRDYPPADDEGFLEFARSLASPVMFDAIKDAEPLTPVRSHRATKNRRRHYERLRRQPPPARPPPTQPVRASEQKRKRLPTERQGHGLKTYCLQAVPLSLCG